MGQLRSTSSGDGEGGSNALTSNPDHLMGADHFGTRRQAKDEVMDWLQFYNHRRLHSTLGYLSPMNFEKARANERKGLGEEESKVA